ncbi:MAG: hypothetical protein ABIH23_17475, partial [bacterium]
RGDKSTEAFLETAVDATALEIEAEPPQILADGRDASVVTIRIVDPAGRLAPDNKPVSLEIEGPGALRTVGGLPVVIVRAGIGRFVLQSTGEEGQIMVRAAAVGLPDGQTAITAVSRV